MVAGGPMAAGERAGLIVVGVEREVRLPVGAMFGRVVMVCIVGLAVGLVVTGVGGLGMAGLWTALVGSGAVFLGCLGGLMAVRPWRSRVVSRWPMLVFGAQGLSLALTGVSAGVMVWRLLYSAALLDAGVLLIVLPLTWVSVWIALARLVGSSLAPVPAEDGGGVGSDGGGG